MKRCLCALLTVCMLLVLFGCAEQPPEASSNPETQVSTVPPETQTPGSITLPYNREASLDPFATGSRINLDLAPLFYESLTVLDDAWMPQPSLAASVVLEGAVLTATLRENALFSDGSPVTAADVVYSFGKAVGSAAYKAQLAGIAACRAEGQSTAVFTLRGANENAAAALAFPIVKKPGKKDAPAVPVGSGLYVYSAGSDTLTVNPHSGAPVPQTAVRLYHVEREDMLLHTLESGHISYYFDTLSDGSLPRSVKASLSADMPYLVFLGINGYSVTNPAVRQALSAAIDRTALTQTAYKSYARAAVTPFHPLWKRTNGLYSFSAVAASDAASALLEGAGYRGSADSAKKKTLSLNLIYVSGNPFKKAVADMIVQQLASVGVTVSPIPLDYASYQARLQNGDYQLYLGEVRLPHASDLSALFTGQAAYGIRWDSAASAAYSQYVGGTGSLDAFLTAFSAEMPFVPLCYRKGQALFSRSLGAMAPCANNVYYRLDQWTVS